MSNDLIHRDAGGEGHALKIDAQLGGALSADPADRSSHKASYFWLSDLVAF